MERARKRERERKTDGIRKKRKPKLEIRFFV